MRCALMVETEGWDGKPLGTKTAHYDRCKVQHRCNVQLMYRQGNIFSMLLQGGNGIKAESVNGIKAAGMLTPFLSVDTWH